MDVIAYEKEIKMNRVIVEALKKQIPKKPLRCPCEDFSDPKRIRISHSYFCPNEHKSGNLIEVIMSKDDFCRRCGQALDWSDLT